MAPKGAPQGAGLWWPLLHWRLAPPGPPVAGPGGWRGAARCFF